MKEWVLLLVMFRALCRITQDPGEGKNGRGEEEEEIPSFRYDITIRLTAVTATRPVED